MKRITRDIAIEKDELFLPNHRLKIDPSKKELSIKVAIPIDSGEISPVITEIKKEEKNPDFQPVCSPNKDVIEPFLEGRPASGRSFFWNYEIESQEPPIGRKMDQVLLDLEAFELLAEQDDPRSGTEKAPMMFYRDRLSSKGQPFLENKLAENAERVERAREEIFRLAKTFNKKVSNVRKKSGDEEQAFVRALSWLSREIFSKTKYEKGRNRLVDIFAPEAGEEAVADCEGRAKALAAVLDRAEMRAQTNKGFYVTEWEFFRDHVRMVVRSPLSGRSFVLEGGLSDLDKSKKTVLVDTINIVRFFTGDLAALPFREDEIFELDQGGIKVFKRSAAIETSSALDYYQEPLTIRPTSSRSSEKIENARKKIVGAEEARQLVFRQAKKQGQKFWRDLPKKRQCFIRDLALVASLGAAGAAFADFQSDRMDKLEDFSSTVVDMATELAGEIKTSSKKNPDMTVGFLSELDRRWQEEWSTHFDGTDYLVRLDSRSDQGLVWATSILEGNTVCDEINITPALSERSVGNSFWKQLAREAVQEAGDVEYEVEQLVIFSSPNNQIPLSPDNLIGENGKSICKAFEAVQKDGLKLPNGSIRVVLDGQELVEIPFGD
ncbi:MAG: hypothetical protein UX09_C0044G0008 [Candidatus Uhrbacteria bacterium GW2011_GWE2_45_35]|uniref:Uncharacterized protein n=2 Tax=Candidatus Uhriibacteriota TaxID=1752732 RepID=A0A0G1JFT6_9BACT|nr:MAG: hypothetical protein UW63_C0034G0003 [Candidatus Uhrbacteria bacterium GW2011_GWF2_44_350]KKU06714.1 MAG: hypothetical protein UX09_C0044G0008 [Candidatus Uhrbacteria bacterium GW2011_GWE2_45_35]HBR80130.1 hypothetical protein [Candidatus Uhrbacteria bacterium]HCU31681.1 hypothetical protein [Candidatus Uhrbacteria bacterium]